MKSKNTNKYIDALGKKTPVIIRGTGCIPLVVLGQASLFRKPKLIPKEFDSYFTIYFVDFFEKQKEQIISDFSDLQLKDFVDAVENIRSQLKLDKIALFAHSAVGVLAIEYARKYENKVLFTILVATAPIWGDYKNKLSSGFFQNNSTPERRLLLEQDQQELFEAKEKKGFSQTYMARRALFFSDPNNAFWQSLWDGINQDENLVNSYFLTISNYDIRKTPSLPNTPVFLALGMTDYSAPFYAWTDDVNNTITENTIHRFEPLEGVKKNTTLPQKVYYIFNAAHYPTVEDPVFTEKIVRFISERFPRLLPFQPVKRNTLDLTSQESSQPRSKL